MSLGQYNSLGEYCGPHTASSVFLILIPVSISLNPGVQVTKALVNVYTIGLESLRVSVSGQLRNPPFPPVWWAVNLSDPGKPSGPE